MFGDFGAEGFAFNPEKYIAHLKEHFENGEMTIDQALEAASLLTAGRTIEVTREWQVALIALDHEDLGRHFNHVGIVVSKAGIGVTVGVERDDLWDEADITPEEKQAMDVATMACLRRAGIDAHFHEDGTMHIPRPEDEDQDEIIRSFLKELDDLPEQDPDKRGWDKWTK